MLITCTHCHSPQAWREVIKLGEREQPHKIIEIIEGWSILCSFKHFRVNQLVVLIPTTSTKNPTQLFACQVMHHCLMYSSWPHINHAFNSKTPWKGQGCFQFPGPRPLSRLGLDLIKCRQGLEFIKFINLWTQIKSNLLNFN